MMLGRATKIFLEDAHIMVCLGGYKSKISTTGLVMGWESYQPHVVYDEHNGILKKKNHINFLYGITTHTCKSNVT